MIIRVLILLFCALTCFSCDSKKSRTILVEQEQKDTDPFKLKGMRITSLDSILQGMDKNAEMILLYKSEAKRS